jgi:hypothetical protein
MQESLNITLSEKDYYTPQWIFDGLGLEFDTDPAQPIGGIPWIPVKKYFTILDDGLAQKWTGRVWLNPPFSNPTPWVEKFIQHGNGVLLAPTSGNGKWLNTIFNLADAVLLLPPSIKFMKNREELMNAGIPIRCGLFALGEENAEALRRTGFGRVR